MQHDCRTLQQPASQFVLAKCRTFGRRRACRQQIGTSRLLYCFQACVENQVCCKGFAPACADITILELPQSTSNRSCGALPNPYEQVQNALIDEMLRHHREANLMQHILDRVPQTSTFQNDDTIARGNQLQLREVRLKVESRVRLRPPSTSAGQQDGFWEPHRSHPNVTQTLPIQNPDVLGEILAQVHCSCHLQTTS